MCSPANSDHFIKEKFPLIECLEYFSHDCSRQYKNLKNFFYLTHHFQDFNFELLGQFLASVLENLSVMEFVEWSNEH